VNEIVERTLSAVRNAAKNEFKQTMVRSDPLSPASAAEVLRGFPARDGFDPAAVAAHVGKLPAATADAIRLGISASQMYMVVAVPGDRRAAFDWAHALLERMGASGLKMNLGRDKPTDMRIFWGKPDVNTLVEVGGDD